VPGEIESLVAPIPLANMVTWLRADRGVIADASGGVSAWLDASGHQMDARTVAYATDHPTWVQGALAGRPVLRFNGTSNYLRTIGPFPGGADPYAIFVVARPTASGARGLVGWGSFGSTDRVNAFRLENGGGPDPRLDNYWWGNDLVTTPTVPINTPSLYSATFDGTTRTMRSNGVVLGSDTPTGKNTAPTPAFIGRTLPAELFQGDLAEVIVYDGALDDTARVQVETYLRIKYGLY
jgi:hypothetical protein